MYITQCISLNVSGSIELERYHCAGDPLGGGRDPIATQYPPGTSVNRYLFMNVEQEAHWPASWTWYGSSDLPNANDEAQPRTSWAVGALPGSASSMT